MFRIRRRKRNTQAFTVLAWASFVASFAAMFIGIYTLEEPLPVKGYYAVTALFLVMSSFVLQKTIRDNQDDDETDPEWQTTLAESKVHNRTGSQG